MSPCIHDCSAEQAPNERVGWRIEVPDTHLRLSAA